MKETMVDASGRTKRSGVRALVGLMLVPVLSGVAMGAPTPILFKIAAHFASTPSADALVRALITSVGAVMVVGAPLAGLLAERYGERRVLFAALALFTLAGTMGAVLDNLWLILGSRIVLGLAMSATGVTAISLITQMVPDDQRNRWIGYLAVTGSLGSIATIFAAGLLGSINWRLVFLLHLLALPILCLVLPLKTQLKPAGDDRGKPQEARGSFPLRLFLLAAGCGVVSITPSVYVPFHLREIGEIDPARVAAPLIATVVTGALASFSFGWIRRRLGSTDVFAISFLLSATGTAMVAASSSLAIAVVAMLVNGVGIGLGGPNLFAAAAEGDPGRRARRIGLARGGFYGAPLLAQILLESQVASYGSGGALYAVAGFTIMLMIAVMLLGSRN